MKRAPRAFALQVLLPIFLSLVSFGAHGESAAHRRIEQLVAGSSGSGILAAINDDGAPGKSSVVFLSPVTGKVVWQTPQPFTIGSIALTPDEKIVAVGLVGVSDRDLGVVLLDARSGKQVGGLGVDLDRYFMPGQVYPRFGSGVSQLLFSPDNSLLYGLSNDTLFVWDMSAKHYLWTADVPATIEAPPDQPDPLPYGHATTFALSPDGRQIAAVRDVLQVATAGRTRPVHFIRRAAPKGMVINQVDFSGDSTILAAGEASLPGQPPAVATDLWAGRSTRSSRITDCGDSIAWSKTPDLFACQNAGGAHLRNIRDPGRNLGASGPPSDLPILKVGNSLWAAAYRRSDWKDPAKSFLVTLVEVGAGRRVTITMPGR